MLKSRIKHTRLLERLNHIPARSTIVRHVGENGMVVELATGVRHYLVDNVVLRPKHGIEINTCRPGYACSIQCVVGQNKRTHQFKHSGKLLALRVPNARTVGKGPFDALLHALTHAGQHRGRDPNHIAPLESLNAALLSLLIAT